MKMARRPKNLTIEEQITLQEKEIENLSEQLKTAKTELKKLNEQKRVADSQKILEAIASSGKSVEDVLNFINN